MGHGGWPLDTTNAPLIKNDTGLRVKGLNPTEGIMSGAVSGEGKA